MWLAFSDQTTPDGVVVGNIKMSDQVGSEGQDVKLTANLCAPFDKIQWHKRGGFLLDEKSMFTKYSTDRGEFLQRKWVV